MVWLSSSTDRVEEQIGFRNITVKGTDIYLNGKPTFMCCISFHEEIPQRMGRAFSEADAAMLLNEAKALGVNMIRLAHYPQNEYTVRLAEKDGFPSLAGNSYLARHLTLQTKIPVRKHRRCFLK